MGPDDAEEDLISRRARMGGQEQQKARKGRAEASIEEMVAWLTRLPCTLHSAPCTLHPAPCTLPPAPRTHAISLSLTHTPSLSLSLTHTHSLSLTHTHRSQVLAEDARRRLPPAASRARGAGQNGEARSRLSRVLAPPVPRCSECGDARARRRRAARRGRRGQGPEVN